MLGKPKHMGRWLAIAVAIGLVGWSVALAGKPVKPPGNEDPTGVFSSVGLTSIASIATRLFNSPAGEAVQPNVA